MKTFQVTSFPSHCSYQYRQPFDRQQSVIGFWCFSATTTLESFDQLKVMPVSLRHRSVSP